MGRKTIYTTAIADTIIGQLEKGTPLAEICRQEGMPAVRTVNEWTQTVQDFGARFARARQDGWDAIAADCLRIADDSSGDAIETETGTKQDTEFVARSRLRIETRLKLLSKWDPKRYGDRIAIEAEVNAKTLSRNDALAALQSGAITVDEVLGAWTKPVIAIEAETEPESVEIPQATDETDVVDID